MGKFSLKDLDDIIAERASADEDVSYTNSLLTAGTQKCAKKFGEEAVEAVIAAISGDKIELKKEAADVLYHLLVMLRAEGVPLEDVMTELSQRTNQSGLQEKASR